MKIYFYCSYKFSPTGFQFRCYDTEAGFVDLSQDNPDDRTIVTLFSRGGSESAFGVIRNSRYYFTLKRIEKFRDSLSDDDLGKSWSICFGVSADASELETLCAAAYGAYTDFERFGDCLLSMLSPGDIETPYHIDTDKLAPLFEHYTGIYRAALDGETDAEKCCPYGLDADKFTQACGKLLDQKIGRMLECVVLSSSKEYFYKSTGFPTDYLIGSCIYLNESSETNDAAIEASRSSSGDEHPGVLDYVVPAAIAFGAVVATVAGIKVIKRVFKKK